MSNDKLRLVQDQANNVKESLKDAIQLTVDRGEKLDEIDLKAQHLEEHAHKFYRNAKSLKWKLRCKYIRNTAIIFAIVGVVIVSIVWALGGFNH